jgi:cysteinyl-tRNA synthetase
MIKVYDSMSGKKKALKKTRGRALRLFTCGPTVYNYLHIGNTRTYIAFDTIVRYLRYRGFKVDYLQNITDIDDKIINEAKNQNIAPLSLARKYEEAYHEEEKILTINSVTKYARATGYIPEIIKQIKTLVKKGSVYKLSDGYYFDVKSFKNYGKLARRTIAQAEDGVSRIDENKDKRNAADFAVWKFSRPGEPSWKTDIGDGRPGWHIEDTAITEKHFGPRYDIHGGGIDLKFPHHEAEIAIEESVSGKKPLANVWMHSGMVLLKGGKMSKSIGNVILTKDFLKDYSANTMRFLTIQSHYRSRCEFGDETAQNAENALRTLSNFLRKLDAVRNFSKTKQPLKIKLLSKIRRSGKAFRLAMDDDFNTPGALGALFGFMNNLNTTLWRLNTTQARLIREFIVEKFEILGITPEYVEIPSKVAKYAQERELLRNNKQFAESDALRKKIEKLGYTIEDTPIGPLVLPKNNE